MAFNSPKKHSNGLNTYQPYTHTGGENNDITAKYMIITMDKAMFASVE